jgi:transcriptional regulator with XRE-family HTH domain
LAHIAILASQRGIARRRLGQQLADLRNAAGMTQRDLAKQTFVDRSYITSRPCAARLG